jgi:hypothetical protein
VELILARILQELLDTPLTGGHCIDTLQAAIELVLEKTAAGDVVLRKDILDKVETSLAAEFATLVSQP